ncbi:hypothetical protein [Clostridium sp. ZS2-4]|uniref:hypothetical protein n=1 Tax=Clostridium sp. ZS2-4 TaxID=2987703 RepID=UPI00227C00B6|nr:hypothetical protein [Clostridium sp. ZS2-4]MCY6356128.1 hypothetical protein [Clostridium sp. ZS2-4]
MEGVNSIFLLYLVLGVLAVTIVVSIIKKAFKLVIFLVMIIVAVSAYNIFIKGVSPKEEINSYSIDMKYGESIKDYTVKIKNSVDKLTQIIKDQSLDENALKTINKENKLLHTYQEEVEALKHSEKLSLFHDKYCDYLKGVVSSSDATVQVANAAENKNIKVLTDTIKKLNSGLSELSKIKLEDIANKANYLSFVQTKLY